MAKIDPQFFKRRNDFVSAIVVISHVLLVFAPVYILLASNNVFSYWTILVWLYFGFGMNGLLNLLHETAHAMVFRKKNLSEWLGRYFLAPMVFADFDGYKDRHWDHHRFLGVEGETKDAYLINIRGLNFFTLILRSLLCIEASKRFFKQTSDEQCASHEDSPIGSVSKAKSLSWIYRVLVVQSIISGSFLVTSILFNNNFIDALIQSVTVYLFVFMYGLMSVTIFAAALRAIAEHQVYGESDLQGYAALRNFKCNPITRFLMGAYGFGEHETHHLYPGIPYYHLPTVTDILASDQPSLKPKHGYFAGIIKTILGK